VPFVFAMYFNRVDDLLQLFDYVIMFIEHVSVVALLSMC
jgi:hypothetical protein